MAEDKKTYRFEELDDTTVRVSFLNGTAPYDITLTGVTWGMLEDILNVQEASADDPRAIIGFFNNHVQGGGNSIPLKHTMPLFQAIAEYMNQVMSAQKN